MTSRPECQLGYPVLSQLTARAGVGKARQSQIVYGSNRALKYAKLHRSNAVWDLHLWQTPGIHPALILTPTASPCVLHELRHDIR